MSQGLPAKRRYKFKHEKVDPMIAELVKLTGGEANGDLIEEMIISALRMGEQNLDRGDIKILHTTLRELRYAFSVFEKYRHVRKVAIFGSARTSSSAPEYEQARQFARGIAKKKWMVITGAASGIMHAGNEGAGRAASFGVNIRLPFEQHANPHIADDPKLMHFKYFFTRKLIFIKESDATILFPGGFGTHDEGFETLTLVQTGKANPRPIVCIDAPGNQYWASFMRFIKRHLQKDKMIDPEDVNLIHHTHDPREAVKIVADFYKNYHSIRYIGDRLVLRIQRPVSSAKLKMLNREFKDIVKSGSIEQQPGHFNEEANEPDIAHLSRLSFHFNRHGFGRLHKMIRMINKG